MPNAFTKAASSAKAPGRSKKPPETVWPLAESDPLRERLSEFVAAKRDAKDAEARAGVAQPDLTEACWDRFVAHLVEHGDRPGSTMKLVGREGEAVAFVVAEDSVRIDDEAKARLEAELGTDVAAGLLADVLTIKLDPDVLAQPCPKVHADGRVVTVYDWLGERMHALLKRGVKEGRLTQDQADSLIAADRRRVLGPGLIAAVAALPDRTPERLRRAFEAVGGIKRYVKV